MGNDKQGGTTASTWTTQVYVAAILCLVIGIGVGYLIRGSSTPSRSKVSQASAPSATQAQAMGASGQVTPEQLKHMGEKQAEPMLAALQKDPNNAALLAQIGTVYFRTQQFTTAADYYERSVKIKPDAEILVSAASAYHYSGSEDRAIDALNRALAVDPKSADALFNLGLLQWQIKNDPKAAIAYWQKLLKTNPNHPRRAEVETMIARAKQHMNMPAGTKTDKPAM